jgi:hypothetical protein
MYFAAGLSCIGNKKGLLMQTRFAFVRVSCNYSYIKGPFTFF